MATGSKEPSGGGLSGVLKGGGGRSSALKDTPGSSVLKGGGRSVLKDRWREQSGHRAFGYDPFGPNSDWNIDFEEGDIGAIADQLRATTQKEHQGGEDIAEKLAREASLREAASERPPMCVSAARGLLAQRIDTEGHVPVHLLPEGLSEKDREFVQSHTCSFVLHCKRHHTDGGDVMPMFMRPLGPSDRDALTAGLGWLSLRSQIMRFLSPMPRLSEHELAYLTELDYKRHFAWCLVSDTLGVGVGRYVCSLEDPTKAELALTVIDPLQGLGLSSLLTWAISHVAYKNGVEVFTGVFHTDNVPIHRMLDKMRDTGLHIDEDNSPKGINSFEISLPMPIPDVASSLLSEDDLIDFMHAVDGHASRP